jgi:hypothetical protein
VNCFHPHVDHIIARSNVEIEQLGVDQIHGYRNPILRECEDETHIPEMGTWESSGTPETSEFNCRGQNTLHWGVLYTIEKISKCRC